MKRDVRYTYLYGMVEGRTASDPEKEGAVLKKRSHVEKLKYRRQSRHVGLCKKQIHY
jgi:hypothetical protein